MPRIYDAAPGSVLIDGRPVREFPLEVLRKNIGFVPQETFLFSDTVRENIAFRDDFRAPDQTDSRSIGLWRPSGECRKCCKGKFVRRRVLWLYCTKLLGAYFVRRLVKVREYVKL